jgi:hypothetical protein
MKTTNPLSEARGQKRDWSTTLGVILVAAAVVVVLLGLARYNLSRGGCNEFGVGKTAYAACLGPATDLLEIFVGLGATLLVVGVIIFAL